MPFSEPLFTPIRVGNLELKHRIVLAPLTRFRANAKYVPSALQKEYYAQRAASIPGTLLIAEGTYISPEAGGWEHAPGIWNQEQIEGWKNVTDAVHSHSSYIFNQQFAMGRVATPSVLQANGYDVVGPSAIPSTGLVTPRALSKEEIQAYVGTHAKAARNAIEAGFDGVEIHCGNGYLLDQFIQSNSNQRTDEYGGSVENRLRFIKEVVDVVVQAVGGAEKVGLRISPWSVFQDMRMPASELRETFSALIAWIRDTYPTFGYLSLVEPRITGSDDETVEERAKHSSFLAAEDDSSWVYDLWSPRPLLSAGGYSNDPAKAASVVQREGVLAVFGRAFVPNPDLPLKLKNGTALTPYDRTTFYVPQGDGPEARVGYLDHPIASVA